MIAQTHQKENFIPGWMIYPLAVLIIILRAPDRCFMPQLWAEDGQVFLAESVSEGWPSIFDSYAGYLHFFLRLVAIWGRYMPLEWVPGFYYLGAIALLLLGMYLIQNSRIELPGKSWLALCLPLVVLPGATMFNLTNAQWYLAPAIVFLLLQQPPSTWRQSIYDTILIVCMGLTGPFIVLWSPLIALRLLWYKLGKFDIPVLLGAMTACGVQLSYILKSERIGGEGQALSAESASLADMLNMMIFRPWGHYFFGNFHNYIPYITGALGLLLVLVWFGLLLKLPKKLSQFNLAMLACGGVVLGTVLISWKANGFVPIFPGGQGERYYVILFIFATQSLVMLAFSQTAQVQKATLVLLSLAGITTLTTFSQPPLKYLQWERRINTAKANPKKNRLKVHPFDEWDLSLRYDREKNPNPWLTKDYILKDARPLDKKPDPTPEQDSEQ